MALLGKLEIDVEMSAPASDVGKIFIERPYLISNISPGKVLGVDLLKGEWGKVGSIIYWRYLLDGKPKAAKEIVEAVDEENISINYKLLEGDLMDDYKSFQIKIGVTPTQKGSVGSWTLEYEKLNVEVPDPVTTLQFLAAITKDIDAYLMEGSEKPSHLAARA